MTDTTPIGILRRYWGYDAFRECQEEIIESVLEGHDTIGLLPTGGGKSITFQVPALLLDGLTVVVTPLISLMKDQVDNLMQRGIKAVYFHSGMSLRENNLAESRCSNAIAKIVYISPEKLARQQFLDKLRSWPVKFLVVDEAHCISQWGYDFRPSYLHISAIKKYFPNIPTLALTASATPDVVDDIAEKLQLAHDYAIYRKSFTRKNISYLIRYSTDKEAMMLRVLNNTAGSAIVYARSRRTTRELCNLLQSRGISAEFYHAGLSSQEKSERQDEWKNGRTRVMVATNAFGMGIDKPDVRVVIHYDMPPSLEEYYQEAGRAGRDGLPAFAILIVAPTDKAIMTRRLNEAFPGRDFLLTVYEKVGNFLDIAIGDGYDRVYDFNLTEFCRIFELPERSVRSSLGILTRAGCIEFQDDTTAHSRVMIQIRKSEFYDMRLDMQTEHILDTLLRRYTGLFADYVPIDEVSLARECGTTPQVVYEKLLLLTKMKVLHYIPKRRTPFIYYPTSRELPKHVEIPRAVYEEQRERYVKRMEAIKRFAFDTDGCRVRNMLTYFGEKAECDCGTCDVCRDKKKAARHTSRAQEERLEGIVEAIVAGCGERGIHSCELAEQLPTVRAKAIECARRLVDEGRLQFRYGVFFKN